jgi:hypothetical protein
MIKRSTAGPVGSGVDVAGASNAVVGVAVGSSPEQAAKIAMPAIARAAIPKILDDTLGLSMVPPLRVYYVAADSSTKTVALESRSSLVVGLRCVDNRGTQ